MSNIVVAALYQFAALPDYREMQPRLQLATSTYSVLRTPFLSLKNQCISYRQVRTFFPLRCNIVRVDCVRLCGGKCYICQPSSLITILNHFVKGYTE